MTQLKKMAHSLFCIYVLFASFDANCQDSQSSLSSQMSSALSGAASIPEQFAQGFGYCPSSYVYSMSAWNDLAEKIEAEIESVVSVQGAKFNSDSAASHSILPYQSSKKSDFFKVNVCHAIVKLKTHGGEIFSRPFDIVKNDKTTYYYHAFALQGVPEGEFLGPGLYGGPYTQTSEFDGVFFNNTPYDVPLSFSKSANGKTSTYTATLEVGSFNLLSSDKKEPFSIRPQAGSRSFTFTMPNNTVTTIPLLPFGLAQSYYDASATATVNVALTATYELYGGSKNNLQVGIQGFNMGNHNQIGISAVKSQIPQTNVSPIRDINPLDCSIWYQSPEQYQASQSTTGSTDSLPFSLAENLWAVYHTPDHKLFQQLPSGQATSFSLLRPTARQKNARLHVFSLPSAVDGTAAKGFLERTATDSRLLKDVLKVTLANPATMSTQALAQAVAQALRSPTNGIIVDKQTGITGVLLLTDTISAYGGGRQEDRFYVIPPPLISTNNLFASIVTSQLNLALFQTASGTPSAAAQAAQAEFRTLIGPWLKTFMQNYQLKNWSTITPATVPQYRLPLEQLVPDLTSYLKLKGAPTLVVNPQVPANQRQLSVQGLQALYLILLGPVSLKSPPLIRQAGTNAYLAGTRPKNWPA